MKLRLLIDIPVDPAFGLRAGDVVDAYVSPSPGRGKPAWFTTATAGDITAPVGIMRHEAEEVADPTA